MIALPIITTIVVGLLAICVLLFLIDGAETKKEIRFSTIILIIFIWIIVITWTLYYN